MALQLRRPPAAALAVIAAVLVLDQVTKAFVLAAADRLPVTLFDGVGLEIVHNTGISFSLFNGRGWLVAIMVGLATLVLLVLFITLPRRYSVPLALLLGGSVGNFIDRARFGYVVDYVAISWWPRFNVADIAVISGAVLMVLMVITEPAVRAAQVEAGGGGQDSSPAVDDGAVDSAAAAPDDGNGASAAPTTQLGRPSESGSASADRSVQPSTEAEREASRGSAEP